MERDLVSCMLVRMWQNSKMAIFHVEIYFSKSSLLYSWKVRFSIYMSKEFILYQCCLLAIKCFFFSCQFTCTIFIHQEGLVMSLGLTTGESGNRPRRSNTAADNFFIPNAEEFFASILSIFSQCTASRGCARWRPSWVIIEKTRTVWRNITCHISTHNRITSWPRGSEMRHRATFERLKTNLGETGKRILVIIMRKMTMRIITTGSSDCISSPSIFCMDL